MNEMSNYNYMHNNILIKYYYSCIIIKQSYIIFVFTLHFIYTVYFHIYKKDESIFKKV